MLNVDLKEKLGPFKMLNGACCFDTANKENFHSYHFQFCRLHDQNSGQFVVDIAQVFPNFNADELREESYDFRATDLIISDLVSHGTEVIYRLGNTIDHTPFPRWSEVPKDYAKWARICGHIIAHYNEGWDNGFTYGIRYWEIWNEPDLIYLDLYTMWQGTEEQYFELYKTASLYLKKRFPEILIGGYSAARSRAPFFEHFLAYARDNKLPLDFFSWHRYGSELDKLVFQINRVRRMLDEYGFEKTISIIDEFNYAENSWFGNNAWCVYGSNPTLKESFFTRMKNNVGASYLTAAKILMMDLPVDIALFYDAQHGDFGSLYDQWGSDTKSAKATRAFSELIEGERVITESDAQDVYIAASEGKDRADVLISCFECRGSEHDLKITGVRGYKKAKVKLINDFFFDEVVREQEIESEECIIPLSVRPYNVMHVILEK